MSGHVWFLLGLSLGSAWHPFCTYMGNRGYKKLDRLREEGERKP